MWIKLYVKSGINQKHDLVNQTLNRSVELKLSLCTWRQFCGRLRSAVLRTKAIIAGCCLPCAFSASSVHFALATGRQLCGARLRTLFAVARHEPTRHTCHGVCSAAGVPGSALLAFASAKTFARFAWASSVESKVQAGWAENPQMDFFLVGRVCEVSKNTNVPLFA
jgi:hypothetical protein